jgi:anti-sigma regulatory factor (Ser/Thr protein kinase)
VAGSIVHELTVSTIVPLALSTRRFAAEPSQVRTARAFVADALSHWSDERLVGDALLLTSELATNAVVHAQTPFVVTVQAEVEQIRVEVADENPAMPRLMRVDTSSMSGRGMHLVDELAESWGCDQKGAGKSVWFELSVEPAPGA